MYTVFVAYPIKVLLLSVFNSYCTWLVNKGLEIRLLPVYLIDSKYYEHMG